jgi:uncharacterized protein with NRDE domain
MCLVFIAFETAGNVPVMIGANREESRLRPSTSPVCCERGRLRSMVAGADHGPDGTFADMGTWLGVNEAGLAVAVTNRSDTELAWADQVRSRGLLAVELLGFTSAEAAARVALTELRRPGYGGCNFLIAQTGAAFVVEAAGASRVSSARLAPGIHAMTNLDLDAAADPRIQFVKANLNAADFRNSAARICRDQRIIIAGPDRGTVCSSLILAGEQIFVYHILGDPRAGAYEEYRLPDFRFEETPQSARGKRS